jgi:hypothetical protein
MERVKPNGHDRVRPRNHVRLFLDSGAYGAWSRGEEIDIKKYAQYCKENHHLIHQLVNLDVIPGKFGRRDNSQAEVEDSAKKSHKNQQWLKDKGLKPIPVFHQGERLYWLELMLKDGEDYIGLSPSKFVKLKDQMRWLDMVFNILTDSAGRPLVKTHGFAATSHTLMVSYPWRSVDSTTWSLTPGYGQIIIPAWIHDQYDYLHRPTRVIMSGVEQKNKNAQEKQYEVLSPVHAPNVERYVRDVIGSTITKQRFSSVERCKAMLVYYLHLNERLHDVRFRGGRASLFGPDHFDRSSLKPQEPWTMIQYFATEMMHKEWGKLMNDIGANDRLLSYWLLKDRSNESLETFVTKGAVAEWEKTKLKPNWDSETYNNRRRLALYDRIMRGSGQGAEDTGEQDTESIVRVSASEGGGKVPRRTLLDDV